MSYQILLHDEASEELADAYHWYEDRSEGLGERFLTLLNKRLHQIADDPERYPKKRKSFRETTMDTFPYVIVYEVFKKDRIVFVSYIFHFSRNPRLKYKR
ncbi:type II toxin-antitoxin system RelE/ParE family toxin [Parasegetibacter sp. NRK P23]|uniref:type II toxin-antitoxin system RelE/ParE family toxin n=1 Tax=Parasegetibacter sp. NRK P23 TaxID=2942999 RepID=UPI0020433F8F|nr:type II toxin-antitoxin system RelE/ParE family toxin [Parasegetibacter sp. NRK P23]MCM5526826.1 type II toxin-antitoxin system RelE/ParE family toxin [Parasegetibacter sp. NRK P23]